MSFPPEPRSATPPVAAADAQTCQQLQDKHLAPYPNYTTVYQRLISTEQPHRLSRRQRAIRIFLHSVLLVVSVLVFFPALVENVSRLARSVGHELSSGRDTLHGSDYSASDFEDIHDCVRFANWSVEGPGDYFVPNSEQITHYPYIATASIDIPVSSALLYVLSSGALSNGVVEVTADGPSHSDVANVSVNLSYHRFEELEKAHVCQLQRAAGKNGVGIFTPENWRDHPHHFPHQVPFFAVKISFPKPSDKERLKINSFEMDMPGFLHAFGDLGDVVNFEWLVLRSVRHAILVKSLFAYHADMRTSNGPISGNFTSNYLILHSNNNSIVTNVALFTSGTSNSGATLVLQTSNEHISSNITLVSTSDDCTGGLFHVTTTSSNGSVDLKYVDAPIGSALRSITRAPNSPVKVTAHKTYEGKFSLRNSPWSPINIEHDKTVEDPTGRGRKRLVALKEVHWGYTEGTVRWVPGDPDNSQLRTIELNTFNAPLHLKL